MNEFQEWCKEMLPIVQAAANGEELEFFSETLGAWKPKYAEGFTYTTKYRIKPKTIRIGEYDVPEPVRKELEPGTRYYSISIDMASGAYYLVWNNREIDKRFLSRGLIHLNQEAAEIHAKALISLTAIKEQDK